MSGFIVEENASLLNCKVSEYLCGKSEFVREWCLPHLSFLHVLSFFVSYNIKFLNI